MDASRRYLGLRIAAVVCKCFALVNGVAAFVVFCWGLSMLLLLTDDPMSPEKIASEIATWEAGISDTTNIDEYMEIDEQIEELYRSRQQQDSLQAVEDIRDTAVRWLILPWLVILGVLLTHAVLLWALGEFCTLSVDVANDIRETKDSNASLLSGLKRKANPSEPPPVRQQKPT